MDTQGCFHDKTSMHDNSLIFAVSCILSSTLIYNIPKQLSEDLLQFLQLFVGYAKINVERESTKCFSKLVFLIRDCQFLKDYEVGYHDSTTRVKNYKFKKDKLDVNFDMNEEIEATRIYTLMF